MERKYSYLARFFLRPPARPLSRWLYKYSWLTPNKITLFGFLIGLSSIFYLKTNPLLAAFLIYLAGVFDHIDGMVAKLQKKQSNFGAWFDGTLDKVLEQTLLFFIAYHHSYLLLLFSINLLFTYFFDYMNESGVNLLLKKATKSGYESKRALLGSFWAILERFNIKTENIRYAHATRMFLTIFGILVSAKYMFYIFLTLNFLVLVISFFTKLKFISKN